MPLDAMKILQQTSPSFGYRASAIASSDHWLSTSAPLRSAIPAACPEW